jgi:hypothetical protein
MLFDSIIKNPKSASFDGKDVDEEIQYVFRRHFITNVPWIVLGILLFFVPKIAALTFLDLRINGVGLVETSVWAWFLVFWYLFTFGFLFENFISWFFDVFMVTNKRIVDIDFEGVLYRSISETNLNNIEDATSRNAGALGAILDIGDITIQTAGERREFELDGVHNPSMIRDLIMDFVAEYKRYRRQR